MEFTSRIWVKFFKFREINFFPHQTSTYTSHMNLYTQAFICVRIGCFYPLFTSAYNYTSLATAGVE